MEKNIYKILGVIVLFVMLVILIITRTEAEEKPFNMVELSYKNVINNSKLPSYYDTIISVAMDEMGLIGHNVIVMPLSDGARNQFDGTLKAHIRYWNGAFYVFVDEFDREESIEVLSHEVIHMQQYNSEDLIYTEDHVIWKGDLIGIYDKEYEDRPWEVDAYNRQRDLIKLVEKVLWEE